MSACLQVEQAGLDRLAQPQLDQLAVGLVLLDQDASPAFHHARLSSRAAAREWI